jgi:hypothetical protein
MKKQTQSQSTIVRIIMTYTDVITDGIAWAIAALISIYAYGPYGLWKSHCDYQWIEDLYELDYKLKKELDRQHDKDMTFYMWITVINLLAWTATILLFAKYF